MDQLISILNPLISSNKCLLDILEIIKSFDFSAINIDSFLTQDPEKTSLQRNLLFRNSNYEIYLLVWPSNFCKDYHYHPRNGCILHVLKGQLLEIIKNNNIENHYLRDCGETSYIDNSLGIHKIIALEDSISLHIYSPPRFYEFS